MCETRSSSSERIDHRTFEADAYRVEGLIRLAESTPDESAAEQAFQRSLAIAHKQSAKGFALRTALPLARLWQTQGKRLAAHDLLAPVYDWFTEGFETSDLKDAKALLDELK